MSNPPNLEDRVTALETRMEEVAADAAAARHLAAARDRDLADLTVKVDANRQVINALGVQTAARFDQVDARFDQLDARFDRVDARLDGMDARFEQVDRNFAEVRARLDQTAGGMAQIAEMLTVLIERDDD